MKKAISILLSVVLLLSVMPMMLASAKVEDQWNVMYDWEQYSSRNEFPELYDVGPTNVQNVNGKYVDYTNYAGIATITNATNYPLAQTNRLEGSIKAFDFQQNAFQVVTGSDAYARAGKIKLDTTMMAEAKDLRFYMCYEIEKDKDGNLVNQVIGIKLSNGEVRFQNGWNDVDENGETMNSRYCQKWNWYSLVGKSFKLCTDTSNIVEITEENVKEIEEILIWNRVNTEEIQSGSRRNYTYFDNFEYFVGETTEEGEITDVLATDDCASIRLGEVNGIRFYTTIDKDALAELVGDKKYEVGTLIAPKDLAGDYLTIEDDCRVVPYDMENDLWEGSKIVGSIVNIRETDANGEGSGNIARDFVARAYVLVDDVYYYSNTQSVRSLAGVADAFKADTEKFEQLDAEKKALVDTWASKND